MRISPDEFRRVFHEELEAVYGVLLSSLVGLGVLRRQNGCYDVNELSAYWIHRLQNEYALNYINRLWGRCRTEAWPSEVVL